MAGRDRNPQTSNLGTAAAKNIGTSGNKVPVLDGTNTWSGNQNLSDSQLIRPIVKDYAVENASPSISSGTLTLDYSTGPDFDVTLDANVTTFSVSNWPASGDLGKVSVQLKQDATGSRTFAWPAGYKWAGGTAPTISSGANDVDEYVLWTRDGGTTVYGVQIGADFS